jgi:DNA polymerase/3'-5' exonuclease PolX
MRFEKGRLWRGDNVLPTPEEIDVFRSLGLAYVEPEKRIGSRAVAMAAGKGA